jgi:hypothetical protein
MNPKLRDPLKSFRFKQSRGQNRKSLSQVPAKYSHSRNLKHLSKFIRGLDVSNKVVDIAKKAPSGLWRISKGQVLGVARKYKFNVPDQSKPMKHLGSTGIQLIRYKPGVFYLYKPRRKTRKKSVKGSSKMIQGITYPGL